jgi:hypothetical protein
VADTNNDRMRNDAVTLQQAKAIARVCHEIAGRTIELAELKQQFAEDVYRCVERARHALVEGRAQDALRTLEPLRPPLELEVNLPVLPPSFSLTNSVGKG